MGTSLRQDFDGRLPAIEQAIEAMPGDLDEVVPGMTKERLRRFFQRFSVQLGKLDKRGAKHPQYLAWEGITAPHYLLSLIDSAISHMGSGASTFAHNSLPKLTEVQDSIDKAIGADPAEIRSLSLSVAADLANAVAHSDEFLQTAQRNSGLVQDIANQTEVTFSRVRESSERAVTDAERVSEIKRSVELLVSPDGRSRTSLEALARRARERIVELEELAGKAQKAAEQAGTAAGDAYESHVAGSSIVDGLRKLKTEAEEILNLSSQAGLAASYKQEATKLQMRSAIFTGVLYAVAMGTLLIAAFWVLPELHSVVTSGRPGVGFWQALSLTLLRASVLAPLVYVLYFTTKRVSALETLRMDYAEKAAASLAYSGYREQMTNEDDLLKQLKGSLLIKFSEHPERLLRPDATHTSAKIKTAGFEAETSVNSQPPPAAVAADDPKDE